MIHLIVKDGLGNQMFQYAYARCLQEHYMKEGICEELAINPYFIEHRFFLFLNRLNTYIRIKF